MGEKWDLQRICNGITTDLHGREKEGLYSVNITRNKFMK